MNTTIAPRLPSAKPRIRYAAIVSIASRRARRQAPARLAVMAVILANLAAILAWLGSYVYLSWQTLTPYTVILSDGSFQLFNPLRRIAAGQRGGVDFQYFHGLGVPYLHYPLFAALGEDFTASEWTRQFVSLAAGFLGYLLPLWAATRRVPAALALTTLALVVSEQFHLYALAIPHNSLQGVRCLMPMVVFAVLLWNRPRTWDAVLTGIAAGFALLLGTEHGMAISVALAAVWLARRLAGHPGGSLLSAFVQATTAAGTYVGVSVLIGGPAGAMASIRYALIDIPADQFWYFGVPPNPFVDSPRKLLEDRLWLPVVSLVFAAGVACATWAIHCPNLGRDRAVVFGGMALYAGLSTLSFFGYINDTYLHQAQRVLILLSLIAGYEAVCRLRDSSADGLFMWRVGVALQTAVAESLALTGFGPTGAWGARLALHYKEVKAEIKATAARPIRLSPWCEEHFGIITRLLRENSPAGRPPVVWSTYASLPEAELGVFHPAADYAIQPLGPTARAEYLRRFREVQPDLVCTFRRWYFGYEEWLQNSTWGFYEEVVLNYEPVGQTGATTVWKRTDKPWRTPSSDWQPATPVPGGFQLPDLTGGSSDSILVVEARYGTRSPYRRVPVFGRSTRYFARMEGTRNTVPVSLPPKQETWTWAVYPTAGQPPVVKFDSAGPLGEGKIHVSEIRVRRLDMTPYARHALIEK